MHAKDPAAAAGLCWKEPASHTPASFPRCPVPTNTSTTCVKPERGFERCVARAEQLQGIKGASFLPVLPLLHQTPAHRAALATAQILAKTKPGGTGGVAGATVLVRGGAGEVRLPRYPWG